jgi:WD40 repeat protein
MPHQPALRRPGRHCLALTSLHAFGGPLAEHCAAGYGGGIVVWGVGSGARPVAAPAAPRAVWKAHDSLVTALHRSAHGLHLLSGAADGGVHLWSMKVKPAAPLATFRHAGGVAGVHHLNETTLVAAAGDGVSVWDMRHAAAPRATVRLDGRAVGALAVSPFGDAAAVATAGGGLFAVDLLDPGLAAAAVAAAPLPQPVTALAWNTATGEVVAGSAEGRVRVYKQRQPGYV